MATSGKSDTPSPMSDHITKELCDLCLEDNDQVKANAFCSDCVQYLCESCDKVHRRGATTKQHKTLKGKDLPSKVVKTEDVGNNKPEEAHTVNSDTKRHQSIDKASLKAWIERKPVYVKQFDLKFPSDEKAPEIQGLIVMSDGALLMCDHKNKKLKLFDSEYEPLSEVSLPNEPWGIISIKPDTAIVSMMRVSYLQYVKRDKDKISLEEQLQIDFTCEWLMKFGTDFFVSGFNELYRFIGIMDAKGKIRRSIFSEPIGAIDTLKSVFGMTFSPKANMVYTLSKNLGCVGISMNGEVVFNYKEASETLYYGACSDHEEFVYVACCGLHKIIMINRHGEKVKDLLALEGMKPAFMAYSQSEDKLFVERNHSNKMLCYQMKM